ncbi:hypothetical protein TNCV_2146071 [Trichonephila clavipes]|uniref:Uncharacterized protein n=1 Tax=Trichonephila clavipes TaxID=2585209 RepID=A0A8X6VRZ3_TRICX|nr:hypothetical protein TNCV_2146071 [Trichonephila clavipes]
MNVNVALFSDSKDFCERSRVAAWSRYRIVAGLFTSSLPVPLKTYRGGEPSMLNLSRVQTSSRRCGVVVKRGVPAQVSSLSLDHSSKLRGPSPKGLVLLNSATLTNSLTRDHAILNNDKLP